MMAARIRIRALATYGTLLTLTLSIDQVRVNRVPYVASARIRIRAAIITSTSPILPRNQSQIVWETWGANIVIIGQSTVSVVKICLKEAAAIVDDVSKVGVFHYDVHGMVEVLTIRCSFCLE